MRYRCLVLDHDDTVTDSTAHIHYPAYLDAMKQMRPGEWMSLHDYFRMNFDPGFLPYMTDHLHFTEQEMDREYEIWQSWVRRIVPDVFPGMAEVIRRQKAEGGYVCVVSHSMDFNIRRDYRENGLPEPDAVFGWEQPPERRKPQPWPLEQIMDRFDLRPDELLMIDDLKPGYDMARSCGVDFAAVGWSNDLSEIERFMRGNCRYYFKIVEALAAFLED